MGRQTDRLTDKRDIDVISWAEDVGRWGMLVWQNRREDGRGGGGGGAAHERGAVKKGPKGFPKK